jgi:DHA1 family multidrug resistance protein-like MFS transporter
MNARNPILILSFTLLVVMLGYGMVLPIMPFYIEKLGAGGRELGWLLSTYSLMQLIFAPLWGILSDRIGRKPVLTMGVLGYTITLLLFGLSTSFWMLFLARTLSGVLSSATMPTAMAYIGDHAPEGAQKHDNGCDGSIVTKAGGLSNRSAFSIFLVGLVLLCSCVGDQYLPESRCPSLLR